MQIKTTGDYKKLSDLLNKPDSVSLITRDDDHLSYIYVTANLFAAYPKGIKSEQNLSPSYLALLRTGFFNLRNYFLNGRLLTCRFTFIPARNRKSLLFCDTFRNRFCFITGSRVIHPASLFFRSPDFPHLPAQGIARSSITGLKENLKNLFINLLLAIRL